MAFPCSNSCNALCKPHAYYHTSILPAFLPPRDKYTVYYKRVYRPRIQYITIAPQSYRGTALCRLSNSALAFCSLNETTGGTLPINPTASRNPTCGRCLIVFFSYSERNNPKTQWLESLVFINICSRPRLSTVIQKRGTYSKSPEPHGHMGDKVQHNPANDPAI